MYVRNDNFPNKAKGVKPKTNTGLKTVIDMILGRGKKYS